VVAANSAGRAGFVTAASLAADPGHSGVEWLRLLGQDGFVGRGLFTLLSGRPKGGKTTLVAHAVRDWLSAGMTVTWLTEEPRTKWRERVTSIIGLDSERLLLGFADGAEPDVWLERIAAASPDVIIIDTARAFLSVRDENDAASVHQALFPVMVLARRLNAALLVLHHRRKADGLEGTDIAGSHAFAGDCDIAISLKEDSASPRRRELSCRSRFDETPQRLLVELSESGEYRTLGAPEQVSWRETIERVKEALTTDWQSTAAIVESLTDPRPGRELVRRALHQLVADGVCERLPGKGNRGDEWRLAATTDTPYMVAAAKQATSLPTGTQDDDETATEGGEPQCLATF